MFVRQSEMNLRKLRNDPVGLFLFFCFLQRIRMPGGTLCGDSPVRRAAYTAIYNNEGMALAAVPFFVSRGCVSGEYVFMPIRVGRYVLH